MRGTKAKAIRRQQQSYGLNTKTKQVYKVHATGQIIADRGRRQYQRAKGRRPGRVVSQSQL